MAVNKNVCAIHVQYTGGFRKLRRSLVMLQVVIVRKMSGRGRRVEDNRTSTDPACCWLE